MRGESGGEQDSKAGRNEQVKEEGITAAKQGDMRQQRKEGEMRRQKKEGEATVGGERQDEMEE